MNVLLSKDFKGRKAGELLTEVSGAEAGAIERLGLGAILKEEPAKAEAKGKGEKVAE